MLTIGDFNSFWFFWDTLYECMSLMRKLITHIHPAITPKCVIANKCYKRPIKEVLSVSKNNDQCYFCCSMVMKNKLVSATILSDLSPFPFAFARNHSSEIIELLDIAKPFEEESTHRSLKPVFHFNRIVAKRSVFHCFANTQGVRSPFSVNGG